MNITLAQDVVRRANELLELRELLSPQEIAFAEAARDEGEKLLAERAKLFHDLIYALDQMKVKVATIVSIEKPE